MFSTKVKESLLKVVARDISQCKNCVLHEQRKNTVPGEGPLNAELMFVGEAPGADEDESGRPFVGRSGQLLTKMIEKMGFKREDVYILNICKCRPPGNRKPEPDEMKACIDYLKMQLWLINPRVVVTLGATATEGLLGPGVGITKRRGNWEEFENGYCLPIYVMPTLHPSYLLRNRNAMSDVADDLSAVLKKLTTYDELDRV